MDPKLLGSILRNLSAAEQAEAMAVSGIMSVPVNGGGEMAVGVRHHLFGKHHEHPAPHPHHPGGAPDREQLATLARPLGSIGVFKPGNLPDIWEGTGVFNMLPLGRATITKGGLTTNYEVQPSRELALRWPVVQVQGAAETSVQETVLSFLTLTDFKLGVDSLFGATGLDMPVMALFSEAAAFLSGLVTLTGRPTFVPIKNNDSAADHIVTLGFYCEIVHPHRAK